jgi:hypothetical protein
LAGGLSALEPPRPEQLARYRADGSLAGRIAAARALGNHRIHPGLVRGFRARLDRWGGEIRGRAAETGGMDPSAYAETYRPAFRSRGVNKTFVLLLDFPDYPAANSAPRSTADFREGDGGYPWESLRNFYRRSSYGALEIQGATLGWYRPAYPPTASPRNGEDRRS